MTTTIYNCLCCGAPLTYSGESGKLECASCGNAFDVESFDGLNDVQENTISFEMPIERLDDKNLQAYSCKNCGAELMTDNTTTATQCPYCGSPTILPTQIEGGVKPQYVLPFKITKAQASESFHSYFKGKKLLPNIFLNTQNRIAEMRKLYVPYWLFDCEVDADMVFDGKKKNITQQEEWEIETTENYFVRRAGRMRFDTIPVDASEKLDDKISESLEPYELSASVAFQPGLLAGAMADHADVDVQVCQARAVERVEKTAKQMLENTIDGYDKLSLRSKTIHSHGGKATPILAPMWIITTEKNENGQKKV
ncbi:MAG: hypothetical protein GX786_02975, partial [Clostridiales bacterium]|nr:hypothetical protein [Clostridiales bacterium]